MFQAVIVAPLAPSASGPVTFRDPQEDEHEVNPVVPYVPLYSSPVQASPYVVGTPLPSFTPAPSAGAAQVVDASAEGAAGGGPIGQWMER